MKLKLNDLEKRAIEAFMIAGALATNQTLFSEPQTFGWYLNGGGSELFSVIGLGEMVKNFGRQYKEAYSNLKNKER